MGLPLRFVEPMLPTLASVPPEGDEWLHEIKYGGFRTQLIVDPSGVRAFTRRGLDWSDRYAALLDAARQLGCTSAIIDGEMIVQDAEGRSDFDGFAAALRDSPDRLVFMAFDLLHLDGRDFRAERLIDRRLALQQLIGDHQPGSRIQSSEHMIGGGGAMLKAAEQLGLEGIVSKQMLSRYHGGRSDQWLKIKCWPADRFVVLGLEPGTDGPPMAQLARETAHGLVPAGWAAAPLAQPQGDKYWDDVDRLVTGDAAPAPAPDSAAPPATPGERISTRFLDEGKALRAGLAGAADPARTRGGRASASLLSDRRGGSTDRRGVTGLRAIGSAPLNLVMLTVLIVLLLALFAEL